MAAGDDNDREESPSDCKEDDNGNNEFEFMFKEDYDLHVPTSHGQPDPLHWCPQQGRPFLPRPSGNSNCNFILAVPGLTHYSLHSIMFNT